MGKSYNTLKSYKSGYQKWKDFSILKKLTSFPANGTEFHLFLISLVEKSLSWATVKNVICSVNFYHSLFRQPKPCKLDSDDLIQAFCAKHSIKKSRVKRPLLRDEIVKIANWASNFLDDLKIMRNVSMIMLGWLGFLRYDDLSQVKWSDFVFKDNIVTLLIRQAKTDRQGSGQYVYIPVNADLLHFLKRYISLSGLDKVKKTDGKCYFFSTLRWCSKSGSVFPLFTKKMSYDAVRRSILEVCNSAGVNTCEIGTHSLRIGGCTEASKKGIPNYVIEKHGRWKSGSSRALYQRIDMTDCLKLGNSLL